MGWLDSYREFRVPVVVEHNNVGSYYSQLYNVTGRDVHGRKAEYLANISRYWLVVK